MKNATPSLSPVPQSFSCTSSPRTPTTPNDNLCHFGKKKLSGRVVNVSQKRVSNTGGGNKKNTQKASFTSTSAPKLVSIEESLRVSQVFDGDDVNGSLLTPPRASKPLHHVSNAIQNMRIEELGTNSPSSENKDEGGEVELNLTGHDSTRSSKSGGYSSGGSNNPRSLGWSLRNSGRAWHGSMPSLSSIHEKSIHTQASELLLYDVTSQSDSFANHSSLEGDSFSSDCDFSLEGAKPYPWTANVAQYRINLSETLHKDLAVPTLAHNKDILSPKFAGHRPSLNMTGRASRWGEENSVGILDLPLKSRGHSAYDSSGLSVLSDASSLGSNSGHSLTPSPDFLPRARPVRNRGLHCLQAMDRVDVAPMMVSRMPSFTSISSSFEATSFASLPSVNEETLGESLI